MVYVYCKSERLGCSIPPSPDSKFINSANNKLHLDQLPLSYQCLLMMEEKIKALLKSL